MAPPGRSYLSLAAAKPDQPSAPTGDGPVSLPGDTTVTVDAKSGAVTQEGPDGSTVINFPGAAPERKPRDAARDFDENLADYLADDELATLASRLLEGIEADERARLEWEETANKGADYLGTTLEEPSAQPSPNGTISKVHHTLLMEAVAKSWSNARAELLPVSGPVKVRDDKPPGAPEAAPALAAPVGIGHNGGPPLDAAPPPGTKPMSRSELADALEMDFNHYLTVVDKPYYPDFSKMLFSRALVGTQFRKVYRCPIARRPVSRWVKAQDLIVSPDASHLTDAARVTERIRMRQSTVKRLQKQGHYRDVSLVTPTEQPTPTETKVAQNQGINIQPQLTEDHRHLIYECLTESEAGPLGEDENGNKPGFPLPYRISIDKDSRQVLEIRRNWREGDDEYKVRQRYVKYGFIPGLGFYDLGFIHLIGNPQRACTAIERILIDSGMLKSMPGGVISSGPGSRVQTTEIRAGLGQFQPINTGGQDIRAVIMPFPFAEPSNVLAAEKAMIAADARRLAGIIELPVGEGRVGDVPVGTIMSYIEAIAQVPGAVHKDDHIAQQEEFELLKELFCEEPEALWKFNKSPARQWQIAKEIEDQDLIPAADPNTPSMVHRLKRLEALIMMAGMPQFAGIANARSVWDMGLRILAVDQPQEFTMPPQPPQAAPDPNAAKAAAQVQIAQTKAQTDVTTATIKGQTALETTKMESADRAAQSESEERRAAMSLEGKKIEAAHGTAQHAAGIVAEAQQHGAELNQDHAHHLDEMAAAVPPAPEGPQGGGA